MSEDSTRRSPRLNQITHAPHEHLDKAVKANAPFETLASYTRLLSAQYLFQQGLMALYTDPQLSARSTRARSRPSSVSTCCWDMPIRRLLKQNRPESKRLAPGAVKLGAFREVAS